MKNTTLLSAMLSVFSLWGSIVQGAIIAHYNGEQSDSPLVDQVGGQTAAANESGHLYLQDSAAAGTYGAISLAGSLSYAVGLSEGSAGSWNLDAAESAELGNLVNDFTVMAWVYIPPAGIGDDYPRLIGQNVNVADGWCFAINNKSPYTNSLVLVGYGLASYYSVGNTAVAGVWQHIAVTKSSTGGVKFYHDGNLVAGNADYSGATENFTASASIYALGEANNGGSDASIEGLLMDEVRVYNEVLDAASIKAAAEAGQITVSISIAFATAVDSPDYDLTGLYGTEDWAYWASADNPAAGSPSNDKTGAGLIGDLSVVGGGNLRGSTGVGPVSDFVFTDGTVPASGLVQNLIGLFNDQLNTVGKGVQLDVSSPTASRFEIYVWATVYNGTARLTASMGGIARQDSSLIQGAQRTPGGMYTITVDPGYIGQPVNLQLVLQTVAGTANASIVAVAVHAIPLAGTVVSIQ